MILWILIVIGVLLIIGVVLAIIAFKNKGKKHEPDYYAFFVMGLCWLPLGIVFMATGNPAFSVFFILGLVYFIIGITNKDKWKSNHKAWKHLSKKEKKFRTIVLVLLGLLVVLGLAAYLFFRF